MLSIAILPFFFLIAAAFTPQAAPPASNGVATSWDVRSTLDSLQAGVDKLKPLLDRMKPEEWVQHGAPYSYVEQWKNSKVEMGYFRTSAAAMEQHPEKLSQVLDTFFRLESLDRQLDSFIEGVRKYHSRTAADEMQKFLDEGSRSREKMRQYTLDLARDKEHEYQVMDSEAQRCRAMITRQPPAGRR